VLVLTSAAAEEVGLETRSGMFFRSLTATLTAFWLLLPLGGFESGALGQRFPNCGPDPSLRSTSGAAEPTLGEEAVPVTQRVSVANGGSEANAESGSAAISANGRYVAFHSQATNLVAGDTNGTWDIFVYDRATGSVERVSVRSDGSQASAPSIYPSISGDGRFVAFRSAAPDLVPGDTNDRIDAMVYDRTTGEIERVSTGTAGSQANAHIATLNLSQNGRVVVFSTTSSSLVPGDTNGMMDVFARDLDADRTNRLSISNFAQQPNNNSHSSTVSADGRYVGFRSAASNLVARDTNGISDVFVFDRRSNRTERVNVTSREAQVHGPSFRPTLSAGGLLVVFRSGANVLVPGDNNRQIDVFVRDRGAGTTTRVSVSSSGRPANGRSFRPTISGNGRYVVFASLASNLVLSDTNRVHDVFRHDRRTRKTARVSITAGGRQANGCSINPKTNGDGTVVVFTSTGRNLVPDDTNGVADIFARSYPR